MLTISRKILLIYEVLNLEKMQDDFLLFCTNERVGAGDF